MEQLEHLLTVTTVVNNVVLFDNFLSSVTLSTEVVMLLLYNNPQMLLLLVTKGSHKFIQNKMVIHDFCWLSCTCTGEKLCSCEQFKFLKVSLTAA